MASVRCRNCGKLYSYEKEGCCPQCGAYNRPPRREYVDADGTVHRMEEKVCYERKECHEDEARRVRTNKKAPVQLQIPGVKKSAAAASPAVARRAPVDRTAAAQQTAAVPASRPVQERERTTRRRRAGSGVIMCMGLLIALISVMGSFLQSRRVEVVPVPETVIEAPAEWTWESEKYAVGELFTIDGNSVAVEDWILSEDGEWLLVWISQEGDEALGMYLDCRWEGSEFFFDYEDMFVDGDAKCYVFNVSACERPFHSELVFYGYDMSGPSEIIVPLHGTGEAA